MPLKEDQIEGWSFRDLVAEGVALLPAVAPEWTNFNAADPGITLLELFAYFTELLLFQCGQITLADRNAFLRLLTAGELDVSIPIEEATQRALLQIRQPQRAVTCADYESLSLAADPRIARAKCVPHQDLAESNEAARNANRPGHLSVVLVTKPDLSDEDRTGALNAVGAYLHPRRILTTRVHVVPARRVGFEIRLRLVATADVTYDDAVARAREALQTFVDPLQGGPDGSGWPIGRDVFVSELYLVVSRLETTDHVLRDTDRQTGARIEEISVPASSADRLYRSATGDLIGLHLAPDELPGDVTFTLTATVSAMDLSRQI
ncbi:MAG TPA: baseplate J/gp47 family protein [Bryocella sp.]|nr:baseplate J/gp47 family protein [Bryocella sp.]